MEILQKFKEIFSKSNVPSGVNSKKYEKFRNNFFAKIHKFNEGDPNDKWTMVSELGGGTEAKVFKVKSVASGSLNVPIVIAAAKIITIDESSGYCSGSHYSNDRSSITSKRSDLEKDLASYMTEILVLRQCNHDNIVKMLQSYQLNNYIWIIEEFCEYGALDNIMACVGYNMKENALVYVCRQLLSALHYLHTEVHVVHRDIKAGNIMASSLGIVKLADFGTAAFIRDKTKRRYSFIGSPYWMAPEVIVCETNKTEGYSYPVDIWSFGITVMEIAELNPPHYEMNQNRVCIRILHHGKPSLLDPKKWSTSFVDFLNCCCVVKPSARSTAKELLDHKFIKKVTDGSGADSFLNYLRSSFCNSRSDDKSDRTNADIVKDDDIKDMKIIKCEDMKNGKITKDEHSKALINGKQEVHTDLNQCTKDEWAESDEADSDDENTKSPGNDMDVKDEILLNSIRLLDDAISSDLANQTHGIDNNIVPPQYDQIKIIQSSPVDVYNGIKLSDLRSSNVNFDVKAESLAAAAARSVVLIEKTSFSDVESSVTSLLFVDILNSVLKCDQKSPSVLEVIISCLEEAKSSELQSSQQYEVIQHIAVKHIPTVRQLSGSCSLNNSFSSLSLRSMPCSVPLMNAHNVGLTNGGFSAIGKVQQRREESRDFRQNFQMQEKRLSQLKSKQQSESKQKESLTISRRQKLIERLSAIQSDLVVEHEQEIERLEHELNSELKSEIKRKRSEVDKSIRKFSNCQRDEIQHAKRSYLDPQSLNELEMRMFNRVEQFRRLQNQETDDFRVLGRCNSARKLSTSMTLSNLQVVFVCFLYHLKLIFDLEEKELCEKFQMICNHVKDFYSTMRGYMHANQRKELEELDEASKLERESVLSDWNIRRKNAIKYMREVCKTREKQYLKSISLYNNLSTEQATKQFRKFTDCDHIRMQRECSQRDRSIEHNINQLFVKHQQRKEHLLSVQ
ncbi:hypothetical protein GJ496_010645, partial [Pomphorhynchus laevis]